MSDTNLLLCPTTTKSGTESQGYLRPVSHQQHPDYHEGFADGTDLVPLYYGMSREYRSGWMAAHRCKRLLRQWMADANATCGGEW